VNQVDLVAGQAPDTRRTRHRRMVRAHDANRTPRPSPAMMHGITHVFGSGMR